MSLILYVLVTFSITHVKHITHFISIYLFIFHIFFCVIMIVETYLFFTYFFSGLDAKNTPLIKMVVAFKA